MFSWSKTHPHPPMMVIEGGPAFVLEPSPAGIYERHSWTIRNDGRSPLKLRTHFTSGRSGFSLWLGQEKILPPGEKFRVSLTWLTPLRQARHFASHAEVWTNDADQPRVKFRVAGITGPAP